MSGVSQLWVYLQTTPLLGLAATLLAWEASTAVARLFRGHILANPMLICILILVSALLITGLPYRAYFEGGQYVQFLLGPATVALAIPMHANLTHIRRAAPAIFTALVCGSVVASLSAMATARLLGASHAIIMSLAPKSVTTPIAMGVSEQIGGIPSLTAIFVILTGLLVVVAGAAVSRILRVTDMRARGLAAGTAGHGLATARILLASETAGAFGGLAIGLNGLVSALVVPFLARLF